MNSMPSQIMFMLKLFLFHCYGRQNIVLNFGLQHTTAPSINLIMFCIAFFIFPYPFMICQSQNHKLLLTTHSILEGTPDLLFFII